MKRVMLAVAAACLASVACGKTVECFTWLQTKANLEEGKDVILTGDVAQDETHSQAVLASPGMNVTLDLNGHTVTCCSRANSRLVNINVTSGEGATFTLKDSVGTGIVTDGTSEYGGCVRVANGNAFVMEGGTITNCSASKEGGAIYCNGGTVRLKNGTISGCTAGTGGGAVLFCGTRESGSKFENMTFTGNKALNGYGGAINFGNSGGWYELAGCTFTGNSATASGGALSIGGRCEVYVDESVITGNTSGDGHGAIHLNSWDGNKGNIYGGIVGDNLPNDFDIEKSGAFLLHGGLYRADPLVVTNLKVWDYYQVMKLGSYYVVGADIACDVNQHLTGGVYAFCPTNAMYVAAGVVDLDQVTATGSGRKYSLWAKDPVDCRTWQAAKANLEAGNGVKLIQDVSVPANGMAANVSGAFEREATFDLNGHTVNGYDGSAHAGERDRIFVLGNRLPYKLTITDSVGGGGFVGHKMVHGHSGGFACLSNKCQLVINAGTISGFSSSQNGGAIMVNGGDAAFTMNGGTITNCTASGNGGAIYSVADVQNATRIAGGTIAGCRATAAGGAFFCSGASGSIVTGGNFVGNTANYGGTFATGATSWIDVMGGVFSNLTATSAGPFYDGAGDFKFCYLYGGVWENYNPMKGSDDTVLSDGYSCVQVGSKWVIGKIVVFDSNNQLVRGTYAFCPTNAEYVAAGIVDPSKVEVEGSGTSYTMKATVAIDCNSWTMVKSNLEAGSSVRLTQDVSLSGQGQAVHVNGGVTAEVTFDLNGHTVDGYNGSELAGETDRLFILHGSSVYKLTVVDSVGGGGFVGHKTVHGHAGGFAYVGDDCQLVINGGTISGFSSDLNGGAIMVNGNQTRFTMNGGTITNCTTVGNGGAICAVADVQNSTRIAGGTIAGCRATAGGAFYSAGQTGNIVTGGTFAGNSAERGGTLATDDSAWIDVMGGYFSNLTSTVECPFYDAAGTDKKCYLYGGVWENYNPMANNDDTTLSDGCSCVQVGSKWVIGKDVVFDSNNRLIRGTYSFCPTNAEYVAMGLSVSPWATVTALDASYTITATGTADCASWAQARVYLEAGYCVRLTQDVSVSGPGQSVFVNGGVETEVTFDLNGHTVDGYDDSEQAGERDRLFILHGLSVYKLTIVDSVGGGGFVGHKTVHDHAGGFAYVGDVCQLVINGGTISGFSSDVNGGAIMVDGANATFTMNGGTITNCTTAGNGGAICTIAGVQNATRIVEGTIADCRATRGGAFYCAGTSGSVVTGGRFVGNSAQRGGTFATGDTSWIDVMGGCYSNVTAAVECPFYNAADENSSCRLHGGVWRCYNPATSSDHATLPEGVSCVQVGSNYVVGKLVSCDSNDELVNGTYTFCPTNSTYAAAGLVIAPYASVTGSGMSYAITTEDVLCETWAQVKSNLEAGHKVKLTADVEQGTLGGVDVRYGRVVTLDLNGFKITGSTLAGDDYRPFSVGQGHMTLMDSKGGGMVDGGGLNHGDGSLIRIRPGGGSFVMNGGTITGFASASNGGAVYVGSGSSFTMNGGTITNCTASGNGGAIYAVADVQNAAKIAGGTVVDCRATVAGGAFYCAGTNGSVVTGGRFFGNSAERGGTFATGDSARIDVMGGCYSNLTATVASPFCDAAGADKRCCLQGGVWVGYDPATDSDDTVLSDGTSCVQVGSKWVVGKYVVSNANDELIGGKYTFCPTNAEYVAAGLVLVPHATVTGSDTSYTVKSAGSTVSCNSWDMVRLYLEAGNSVRLTQDVSVSGQGQSVYVNGDVAAEVTFDLCGHTVDGYNGSERAEERDRLFVLQGSSVYKLTITDSVGGGAFVGHKSVHGRLGGGFAYVGDDCQLVINGGTISGFSADMYGGAIMVNGGNATFTMNGGTITNCTASYGGAICAEAGVQNATRIARGTIAGCCAWSYGGAFYSKGKKGNVVTGGIFVGNTARQGGTFAADDSSWIDIKGGCFSDLKATDCCPFYNAYDTRWPFDTPRSLYGGVWENYNPLANSDEITLADGYSCVQVGSKWVIGKDVAFDSNNRLIRGTYSFCPTNAEYVAKGLSVSPWATVTASDASYTITATGAADCASWAETRAYLEAGYCVRLTQDVSVTGQGQSVYVHGGAAADVTLDLNGHTVNGYDGSEQTGERDRLFVLHGSSVYKLTIVDSVGGGGFVGHKTVHGHAGGFAYVGDVCQLVINGGTISGFSSDKDGGAIMINGKNTTFAMNGGTITNCTAAGNGGAIYAVADVQNSTRIAGGTIAGCRATAAGGAFFCAGPFGNIVTGGTFVGNAANYGGTFATSARSWIDVMGGFFSNSTATSGGPFYDGADDSRSCYLYGGVWESYNPMTSSDDTVLSDGYSCVQVGSKWVVGKDVTYDSDNRLTGGTYAFYPASAEYVAAGVAIAPNLFATRNETTPVTWTLGQITYPDYLAKYGDAVKSKFYIWATTFGSCDPNGAYQKAFLLNVAPNREEEAEKAFAFVSIVVRDGTVEVELPKPLAPATSFNGTVWLQCASELSGADWKDLVSGSYVDENGSFLRCMIDFEHALTPESFPTEPVGTKTIRVIAK